MIIQTVLMMETVIMKTMIKSLERKKTIKREIKKDMFQIGLLKYLFLMPKDQPQEIQDQREKTDQIMRKVYMMIKTC